MNTSSESLSDPHGTVKRRISYFYDPDVGNYHYGQGHPMKPQRVRMAHNLIVNYGLFRKMDCFRPKLVSAAQLTRFHSDDYINFLRLISPDNMGDYIRQLQRFNVGEDCPVFDGLFELCQIYTSGSIGGAVRLNENLADGVINWAGGLHHAKKSEASGFCYVNDCVLAILELLKKHQRVLYIDIDIHHGDGVEEAFYTSNRVMTCSFHKFGEYFPGTGDVKDKGYDQGENYAINVPLHDGMDDESYHMVFQPVIAKIMERFQPGAVVMQCGADSLSGDRLGCFKLSIKGHAACVHYVKSFGTPMLLLGGGGYTLRNVPRCWTYETAVMLDTPIPDTIPFHDYFEYYGPEYRMHLPVSNMENQNSPKYLEGIKIQVCQILDGVQPVPGTQIFTGQIGTTQIPGAMKLNNLSDSYIGKGVQDAVKPSDENAYNKGLSDEGRTTVPSNSSSPSSGKRAAPELVVVGGPAVLSAAKKANTCAGLNHTTVAQVTVKEEPMKGGNIPPGEVAMDTVHNFESVDLEASSNDHADGISSELNKSGVKPTPSGGKVSIMAGSSGPLENKTNQDGIDPSAEDVEQRVRFHSSTPSPPPPPPPPAELKNASDSAPLSDTSTKNKLGSSADKRSGANLEGGKSASAMDFE